jgi:hypothetical protein
MDEKPGKVPRFQFGLVALFVTVTLAAIVAAVLAWIEPQRQAPLVSVIGSAILIVGACLALLRAVRNLIGRRPPPPATQL